jgi:hypothetical protein
MGYKVARWWRSISNIEFSTLDTYIIFIYKKGSGFNLEHINHIYFGICTDKSLWDSVFSTESTYIVLFSIHTVQMLSVF